MKIIKSLKEDVVDYPAWWEITLEGDSNFYLLHNNWFGARKEMGLPMLKVDDEVDFEIAKLPHYIVDSVHLYFSSFWIVGDQEIV